MILKEHSNVLPTFLRKRVFVYYSGFFLSEIEPCVLVHLGVMAEADSAQVISFYTSSVCYRIAHFIYMYTITQDRD